MRAPTLRLLFSLSVIWLDATGIAVPTAASAQEIKPAHIGVIEMSVIERKARAWADLRAKYKDEKDRVLKELNATQSRLEEEGRALKQQQAILAPDAFESKRAEFERKLREENQREIQRRQVLDKALLDARKQIFEEIRNIVLKIAEEKGLNLILDQSNTDPTIVLAGAEIKITQMVIDRLDQKIQTVTFTVAPMQ